MSLREQMVERFQDHGIEINVDSDQQEIVDTLSEQDNDVLQQLLFELSDGTEFNLPGDEYRQGMVMSYALVHALENDYDAITADDLEHAQREIAEVMGDSEDEGPEQEASEPKEVKPPKKPTFKSLVYDYVQRFPDAQKQEVVNEVLKSRDEANPDTLTVLYYEARKEFNLPTIGQRGRPANSGNYAKMRELMEDNPEASRGEIIEMSIAQLGVTENTAANYYPKLKTQIKERV